MKRFRILLLFTTLMVSLSGCGSSTSPQAPATNSGEVDSLKTQIEELQKENADLKAKLDALPETTVAETKPVQKGNPIAAGDTIKTDTMEITINKVEFSYDVLPDDTSSFYTHYEADAGNVYLHIDTNIKNLGKQNLSCDEIMTTVADYNGGYTYSGFPIPEDSSTGFTYSNITSISPLETLGIHFLIECPQEVDESTNPMFVTLEPIGTKDSYTLTIR